MHRKVKEDVLKNEKKKKSMSGSALNMMILCEITCLPPLMPGVTIIVIILVIIVVTIGNETKRLQNGQSE